MKILILAGGSGTRLWPLSRGRYPKQFIKLMGLATSLFQETFKRSLLLAAAEDIYVITNKDYKFLVMGQVEELGCKYDENNILVEPEAKNTLPAIYYGVHEIRKNGDDTIVVFPSDHMILKNAEFTKIIKDSVPLTGNAIVTFGIQPHFPNTGYGYISPGEREANGFIVNEFKEKPDYATALSYIEKGYLWNSGIFMFDSAYFAGEVKNHSAEIYNAFEASDDIKEVFKNIGKGTSIDYGIMEKTRKVIVVPVDIGWNDLGSFDSFYDVFEKDKDSNISHGNNILIESRNNLIQSDKNKVVAALGVEDLIVVDNQDALLICKKEHSQKVKDVLDILRQRNDNRTEFHIDDYRPWGHYRVLEEEKDLYKIKKITILQGKRLSYQMHHHRSEHWVVVRGTAKVTIDDEIKFVSSGESIFIKKNQKHSLENCGKIPLEIIEVQMGDYLEEDDIIRFNDAYDRE